MLHCLPQPIPQPKADAIVKFLNSEAGRTLMNVLRDEAAERTADAGNLMVKAHEEQGAEADTEDAQKLAARARFLIEMAEKLEIMSSQEYVFQTVQIIPKPLETTGSTG
jgi:hypothetical protein